MPLEIPRCLQSNFRTPSAQEEEDTTARFDLTMDRDDPPEVMMLHIEEIQLFFLAYPDGNHGYTNVQMICQAVKNLQALVHLYAKALTSWHREDPDHHKVWNNFKDFMHTQYEMMLQERGGGTLTDDGYITFNIIVNEDTAILTEAMVNYAEQ